MTQSEFEVERQAARDRYLEKYNDLSEQMGRLRQDLNEEIIELMRKHEIKNTAVEFLQSGGSIRYTHWDDGYDSYSHYEMTRDGTLVDNKDMQLAIDEAMTLGLLIKSEVVETGDTENSTIILNPKYFRGDA